MTLANERSVLFPLNEISQVGTARRAGLALASGLGFNETQAGHLAILITEIATNVVRHAHRGELILRPLRAGGHTGIELLALDKGPGMQDVQACLRDGYSTAGSPGTGLGSISRLSTLFQIYSVPGHGTALLSQLWTSAPTGKAARLEVGVICLPMAGEEGCGDAWAFRGEGDLPRLLVADGLGHGLLAADAADEAVRVFEQKDYPELGAMMQYLHGALAKTRGAAVALAEFELSRQSLRFLGVGNIAGLVAQGGQSKSLISQNGTVGHVLHRLNEFSLPWKHDSLLILHSDGLTGKWKLESYPGLLGRHPALIAGVLYRDWRRERDDVTVMVIRERP